MNCIWPLRRRYCSGQSQCFLLSWIYKLPIPRQKYKTCIHIFIFYFSYLYVISTVPDTQKENNRISSLSLFLYLDNNVWFADSSWNVDRTTEGFYSRIKMVENSFDVCGISQCGRLQTHFFFWQFKLTEQTKYPWSQILSIRLDSNNCLWLDNS